MIEPTNPDDFALALRGLEVEVLRTLVGAEGADRIRGGEILVRDLIVGAIKLGFDPVEVWPA